jgi:hypothetical protein
MKRRRNPRKGAASPKGKRFTSGSSPGRSRSARSRSIIPAVIVIVITLVAGVFWQQRSHDQEKTQPSVTTSNSTALHPSTREGETVLNPPLLQDGAFQVSEGGDIQLALDAAAAHPNVKTVRVASGTYRPHRSGQAMIWFNARHDGITLEAVGEVVLTAANPELSDPAAPSHPAVVNHVVYFGDGISRKTLLRGFKITGANRFVTEDELPGPIRPDTNDPKLKKALFFYADGGGIKIFGRS